MKVKVSPLLHISALALWLFGCQNTVQNTWGKQCTKDSDCAADSFCELTIGACARRPVTDAAVADLAVARVSADFGMVLVGNTSDTVTLTFTNSGGSASGALGTTISGANANAFPEVGDSCSGHTLAPGETCLVTLSFTPQGGTQHNATLTATATPGGTATVALSGMGLTAGFLSISPKTKDFGSLATGGSSDPVHFAVTNHGNAPSGTPSVSLSGLNASEFAIRTNECTAAIPGDGGTCDVAIAFEPSTTGAKSAALVVNTPAGGATASVSGNALSPAALTLAPANYDFGVMTLNTSTSVDFSLTNTGSETSGTIVVTKDGNTSDFSVTDGCATETLVAGASCKITVTFSPTSIGAKSLTIGASASPGGSPTATATGTGADPVTLSIALSGPGGSVVSQPAGIDCGSSCSAKFLSNSKVTLTANPTPTAAFHAWTGDCAIDPSQYNQCTVTMSQAKSITATFVDGKTLTVALAKVGIGDGRIDSTPQGLHCSDATCSWTFETDAVVRLTPTATAGIFGGWTGACSGFSDCKATMNVNQSVGVSFIPVHGSPDRTFGANGTGVVYVDDQPPLPTSPNPNVSTRLMYHSIRGIGVDSSNRCVLAQSYRIESYDSKNNSYSYDDYVGSSRLTEAGRLDLSYGSNGFVMTMIGGGLQGLHAMTQNNWLAISAMKDSKTALFRFDESGAFVAGFESGELGATGSSFGEMSMDLAIRGDGAVLAAGGYHVSGNGSQGQIMRMDPAGAVDFITPNGVGYIHSIALQPDGKMVISHEYGIRRLDSNGAVDPTFNSTAGGGQILVASDGMILFLGDGRLRGLTSTGVETSFGDDADWFLGGLGISVQMALQSDGKIVALEYRCKAFFNMTQLFRYNVDGSTDRSFGNSGIVAVSGVCPEAFVADRKGRIIIFDGASLRRFLP